VARGPGRARAGETAGEDEAMKFHPLSELFPLMQGREFDELVADIRANGLREPIWTYDGQILDGRNRWRACDAAGVSHRPMREYEGDDPVSFVVSMNLHRRHLDESQRAIVAGKLATFQLGDNQHSEGMPIGRASELLNVGERSVARAREVLDHGAPELVFAVESGIVSVSAAADVAELPKTQQREIVARGPDEILQKAKEIRAERAAAVRERNDAKRRESVALPIPAGQYRTIVIDPPWPIEINDRDVRPGQVGMHYPTMSLEEIQAFKLPAADQCMAFIWTTQKFLPATFNIVKTWGLTYLFTMVWHKPGGPQPFNLPQYNCEFVVVARKGGVPFLDTKQFFTCFQAPRREHSRKPDEFYDVVRRVTAGPRIDIFSREPREGFDQFGNETEKFVA
jgi:N6-adenosine-specific RNA methylase IME4